MIEKLVHSFNVRIEGLKVLMTLCSIIRFQFYLKKCAQFPMIMIISLLYERNVAKLFIDA